MSSLQQGIMTFSVYIYVGFVFCMFIFALVSFEKGHETTHESTQLRIGDKPYSCSECDGKVGLNLFTAIKKLLLKCVYLF